MSTTKLAPAMTSGRHWCKAATHTRQHQSHRYNQGPQQKEADAKTPKGSYRKFYNMLSEKFSDSRCVDPTFSEWVGAMIAKDFSEVKLPRDTKTKFTARV